MRATRKRGNWTGWCGRASEGEGGLAKKWREREEEVDTTITLVLADRTAAHPDAPPLSHEVTYYTYMTQGREIHHRFTHGWRQCAINHALAVGDVVELEPDRSFRGRRTRGRAAQRVTLRIRVRRAATAAADRRTRGA